MKRPLLRSFVTASLALCFVLFALADLYGEGGAAEPRGFDADTRTEPAPAPQDLAELARRFLPGHEAIDPLHTFEIRQGQTRVFEQRVIRGNCYAAVALGEGMLQLDIDLFLDDERIGQDIRRDPWPVATFCAPDTGMVEARLFATRGNGTVRARMLIDMDRRQRATGDSHDELVNQLAALQRRVLPRSHAISPLLSHDFPRAGSVSRTLAVPERGCYVVTAVSSSRQQSIAVRVRRLRTVLLAEDRSPGDAASVGFCVDAAGFIEVDLVSDTSGRVALQLIGAGSFVRD